MGFKKKNNKYYRINSDNSETELTLENGYLTWILSDGQKVRAKLNSNKRRETVGLIEKVPEESVWNKIAKVFTNISTGAAVALNPAVMTASGWYKDNKGDWKQDPDSPGAKYLQKVLPVIGTAGLAGMYTPMAATPVINGIKVTGLALTPSTWVGGFFNALGTLAPTWLLNGADLVASAYFAGQAGKEIARDGLNWKTGTNALLSLAPFTREESAIKAVGSAFRNPVSSFSSVIDDFRAARNAMSSPEANFAREFNRSIRNTRFINVPIEHVSTKGVTEGAGLNSYSDSDVGFHFSPAGSPTTYNIQQATNAPFVRTGTWTYTNNTKPVFVIDKGNWRYSYNPEIYNGVNPGKTISENAIALDLKGPNFTYINNYEGMGAKSYMTTLPSFVLLSKNKIVQDDRFFSESSLIVSEGLRLPDGTYTPKIEDASKRFADLKEYFQDWKIKKDSNNNWTSLVFNQNGVKFSIGRFSELPDVWYVKNPFNGEWKSFSQESGYALPLHSAKNYVLKLRNDLIKELDYPGLLIVKRSKVTPEKTKAINNDIDVEGTEVGDYMMRSLQDDVDEVYLSPDYIDRFMRHLSNNPKREDVIARIKHDLRTIKDKTKPVLYKGDLSSRGASWSSSDSGELQFFTGINSYQSIPNLKWWDSTLFHEFGHAIYRSDTPIARFITGTNHDLTLDIKDHIIATPRNVDEVKYIDYISNPNEFRLRVMEAVRYGIRESLTPEEIYNSPIMDKIKLGEYFDKNYLVKMFKYMLATTPLLAKNTDNDRPN